MKPISRKAIFQQSTVADLTIAGLQGYYAKDFDVLNTGEGEPLPALYDHRVPFSDAEDKLSEVKILAVETEEQAVYEQKMPIALKIFLDELQCEEVFLLNWSASEWQEYEFENPQKKQEFMKLCGDEGSAKGLKVSLNELKEVLPLFLFASQFNMPLVYLFPVNSSVAFSLFLCDDGNFHLNYNPTDETIIKKAAEKAQFLIGGFEICQVYYTQRLS